MPTIHIRGNAELILAGYTYARASEGFGKEHDLWTVFDDLKQDFADCPPVRRRPTLRVRWSAGQGNWAKVPWVTFLDERETMTTQRGVYCVYLFRQDMSGMYLTFNQGVTEPKNQQGRIKAHQFLSKRAAELRKLCDGLAESGFRLDDEIDLRADPGLGSDYESSTIVHKFYEADLVPDDEALLEDLEAVLRVYDRYLTDEKWAEALDFCRSILYERADFEADEIEYKQEIVREIRAALDPTRDTEEFAQHLKKAFVNSHNNLTNWQSHDRFTKWAINNPERSREAVGALLDEAESVEERIDRFLDKVPEEAVSGPGTRISIASYLLMGLDLARYPFYKPTPFEKVERVLGWPRALEEESPGAVYAHHRAFAQRLLEELQQDGADARDLLDVQSLIWTLANSGEPVVMIWRGEEADWTQLLNPVLSWVQKLNTRGSPDGSFYYKPLLLLAALDVLDADPNPRNRLEYDQLLEAFKRLAAERDSVVTEEQFSQPYVRMRNDKIPANLDKILEDVNVWALRTAPTAIQDAKADQPSYVRSVAPAALIHPAAWPVFKSQEGRDAIRQKINERWTSDEPDGQLPRCWRVLANYPSLGEKWRNWPTMQDAGFIAIGWQELGDLSTIVEKRDKEGLRTLMRDHYSAPGRWTNEIYDFIAHIEPGDLVLAAEGNKVLGVGRVTGGYSFEPSSPIPHRLTVEWLSTEEWELPAQADLSGSPAVREIKQAENLAEIESRIFGRERGGLPGRRRSLSDLADELLVEQDFLENVVELLRDKGQVIFYGPPGTGKTFVARKLMEYLAPEAGHREVVQFHPSYSYEDFVHGYRPVTRGDGTLAYELKPGPLMRLAQQAAVSPGDHVLLIDEINRGNLPKILGELLYLLEYRDDEIILMYGEDEARFSLPEDLLIIGTMNTADRSIALIDAALRRRFHFVPFFPNEPPLEGLLRRWLKRHRLGMIEVADVVDVLNAGLRERFGPHLQVGPSYFMKEDLDEGVLRRVWDYDVMPFLEDQLFGQEEELERFTLDRLRGLNNADDQIGGVPAEPGAPDEE